LILAALYFLVFCFLVKRLSFFKDAQLGFKFLLAIIAIKALACMAYYWFYFVHSSGGVKGDSSDTLSGAEIIYQALHQDIPAYIKMVLGWHTDQVSDPLYNPYFSRIYDWGNSDSTSEFFLNDNRTSIRFHALVRLLSGSFYAVHALAIVIVSFIGQFAFYKTFKAYFPGREKVLAIIIFLTPSVLFWSSGVLKEPLALALLGLFLYTFMQVFVQGLRKWKYIVVLIVCFLLFMILKPYILVLVLFPLITFVLAKRFRIRRIALFYATTLLLVYGSAVIVLKYVFHKDVINTIVVRQNDFISLSKGGIFFVNSKNYLRLEYKDADQYVLVDSANFVCRIKPHASLMYWDLDHIRDTVFVKDNADTNLYKFLTVNKPAGSGISMERLDYSFSSFARLLPRSLFNVLCRPFFYKAHSAAELVASMENLFILLFFIFCFVFRIKEEKNRNLLWFCIAVVILSFCLIGITTTVAGAIVRYKVPFMPFLLMIPLLYLDVERLRKIPVLKKIL
jgi:hypothetical protein